MKNLVLIRHAKSSWSDSTLSDFERPLNKRGTQDAPFMAKLLSKMVTNPDCILSSPSVRTFQTALTFAKEFNFAPDYIIQDPTIYHAGEAVLLQVIQKVPNIYSTIFVVAHNPGLTELCNTLGDLKIENLPTCGIYSLSFKTTIWEKISSENGKANFVEYPKKHYPHN